MEISVETRLYIFPGLVGKRISKSNGTPCKVVQNFQAKSQAKICLLLPCISSSVRSILTPRLRTPLSKLGIFLQTICQNDPRCQRVFSCFRGEAAIVSGEALVDLDYGFAVHNRSFATKTKKPLWHPGYF